MTYREKELADYLEDCRNREVTPRLQYVKFLKQMIVKSEQDLDIKMKKILDQYERVVGRNK